VGDKKQQAAREIQRLKFIRAHIQKALGIDVNDMDIDEGQAPEV
jgi:hypothetical protein